MRQLADILLAAAGEHACFAHVEDDLALLERYGEFWMGRGIRMNRGDPNRCHDNALFCWDANRTLLRPATGYYLYDDGCWRQHSWCVTLGTAGKGGRVVETTEKGVLYFGVTFTEAEAQARLDGL